MSAIAAVALRPLLKWAGGKRWLVPYLRPMWEKHRSSRLVEPLCGGLAVRVKHPTCESQGAPACTYDLRWNASASLPEPLPIRDVSS